MAVFQDFLVGALVLFFVLLILYAYIITLVEQARKKRWVWFVLTLLFPIVLVVYWIVKWMK